VLPVFSSAQRAMGELQNLRAQITKKDKEIKASAAKQKKIMAMVGAMKKQHATELEKLKLKAGGDETA
jgi:chorismate mutase